MAAKNNKQEMDQATTDRLIEEGYQEGLKIGRATGPADIEALTPAIKYLYEELLNLAMPEIVHCTSPTHAKATIEEYYRKEGKTPPSGNPTSAFGGSMEISWVMYYWTAIHKFGVKATENHEDIERRVECCMTFCRNAFLMYFYEKFVFVSDRPEYMCIVDEPERSYLHNDTGAAVLFADGTGRWCWKGIDVPRGWIENPDANITMDVLHKEPNSEKRRAAIEIYERRHGEGSFIASQPNKLIDAKTDGIFQGELREFDLGGGSVVRFARVQDMTPHILPDGTKERQEYILYVPHDDASGREIRDVREAIASTWKNPITGQRLTFADVANRLVQHT